MKKLKIGKKSGLKYFDLEFIRSLKPCHDPSTKAPANWRGTALDVLNASNLSYDDKFWLVLRPEVLSEKTLRLFAIWCARQIQHLLTDERSIKVLDVAEAYAQGKATKEELYASSYAAYWAAYDSNSNSAYDVAYAAAAASTTDSASYAASISASISASTAGQAIDPAHASYSVSERIEKIKQIEQLKQMVIQEGKERLNVKNQSK